MKRREVFVRVVADIFNKSESEVSALLDTMGAGIPGFAEGWEKEIPDKDGERLIADLLLHERDEIRAWFESGARRLDMRLNQTAH